jgi:transposase
MGELFLRRARFEVATYPLLVFCFYREDCMHAIRTHVAGVDVHKEVLAITILIGKADEEVEVVQFESKTFSEDLIASGLKLIEYGVHDVAMESTGVYWKPIHNIWSPMGINITVGQAAHIKNVPGRKTDMNDSHWIAELHRFGLIRASFIPEETFQRMRLLSRHRTNLVADLGRIKNRVQKTLEDGNIKWGVITSNVFGKSGLQILRLLADGVTDAGRLSLAVTTRIKRKEEARKSLTNCFTREHIFLIKELMSQYDHLDQKIKNTDNELFELSKPYRHLVEKLDEIPGIDEVLAIGILAESTNDMNNFGDERKYAAWAGVAAGNNESAGKKKDRSAEKAILTYEES